MADKRIKNNIKILEIEIKELKEHNEVLSELFETKKTLRNKISTSFADYAKNHLDKDNVIIGRKIKLSEVHIPFNENNNDEDLIQALYAIILYENLEKEIKQLYKEYFNKIETAFNDVKPLFKSSFAWMFTSKKIKAKAVESATYLHDVYLSNFTKNVDNIKNRYGAINYSKTYDDFLSNISTYVHKLNQIISAEVYKENDPPKPDFVNLQKNEKVLDQIQKQLQNVFEQTSNLKQDVINKVNLMLADETLESLKSIPVDELNKDKSGIKINALKNAGIKTMYDAYKTSPWQLSSINGVSDDTAYIIHDKATKIKEKVAQTVKLKLNSDNKTTSSTRLLNSLFLYINNKDIVKEADSVNAAYFTELAKEIALTAKFDDIYKWHKANYEEKMAVCESYFVLSEAVRSEDVAKANHLINNAKISNLHISDKELWDFFAKNSARCYSELDELCPGLFGSADTFQGLPEELVKEIQDEYIFPDGLLVTLRRYQEWGVKYILHQKNVLLGDEMGLGKTIQAIAAMVSLKNVGAKRFVVVCPASVIINWCREIETHSKLKAIKVHGRGSVTSLKQWLKDGGVAVTTYETTKLFDFPDEFKFDMLTVDEAHYCKNPEAKRTINVRALSKHTDRILYMTGTALENKVDEMIELISHLQPEVAKEVEKYSFMSAHEIFKQKVAPVYYRRKREDVLTELPELIVNKEWCTLNKEEKDIYEDTVLNGSYQSVRKVSWNIDDLNKSCKMNRLKEIIQNAKDEDRKVIVFSFFLNTIDKIKETLGDICTQPITGSINPSRRQEIIDGFNDAPAGSVLLAQIQAGGTGLNIQAASVVVIAEPQFKPSIENQAISRAYRMGQTRNVLVHRLLCENTIDEKLMDVLEEKQMIFDAFADESVAANANKEIDEKTFKDIIKEEIERIKAEKENQQENIEDAPEDLDEEYFDPEVVKTYFKFS